MLCLLLQTGAGAVPVCASLNELGANAWKWASIGHLMKCGNMVSQLLYMGF